MKNAVLILIAYLLITGASFSLWLKYATPTRAALPDYPAVSDYQAAKGSARTNSASRINEWKEYHDTREKTLRENPELAAEYKALLAEINKHQDNMDAAMIKADPKVAPLVTMLASIRQHTVTQPPPAAK